MNPENWKWYDLGHKHGRWQGQFEGVALTGGIVLALTLIAIGWWLA